ncbi:hemicentin-1-like [Dendronephthya gigantea]|uniref:hemicentin-1-like n=1 Tax=Dendronephthya gigantea TaxID=151771 RepID=UPI001068F230|nr:hemicentin-1-like [Dendronephthya gigantea]
MIIMRHRIMFRRYVLSISILILLYMMPISLTHGFECSTNCTLKDGKRTVGDENTGKDPPRMRFKTISTSVTLMASIGLNCRVCQSNPASTIEWFFNGKPLEFKGQRMHVTSTPCQETLFLLVILGEDEGNYTCVARNKFGETNSTTEVKIIDNGCSNECKLASDGRRKVGSKPIGPPSMKFERSQKLAMVNSMVEITCALCESNPPSTLTWFYNGTRLDLNRRDVQVIPSCSKESLYFRVLKNNGGTYTCVAKNALGEARSTTEISSLDSSEPMRSIAIGLEGKSGTIHGKFVKMGSPLNITCTVHHTPCGDQSRWLWKRNDKIITRNNTEYVQENGRCGSRLILNEMMKNVDGDYQCSLGHSKNTISLTKVPCFQGFYCPSSSHKALRCPNGTFSLHQNATDLKQCDPCPTDGRNETLSALKDKKPGLVEIFKENCPHLSHTKTLNTDSGLSQGKIVAIALCLTGIAVVFLLIIFYLMRKYRPYKRIARAPLADVQIEIPDVPQSKDVFVCYSSKNQEWVHGTLLSNLRAQNFETFIDFIDFEIGLPIHQNIVNGIYGSRKTIFVLSKDSLKSYYARTELGQALAASCRTGHQVIVILYEKCKVPDEISDIVYLDWTDEEKRDHFWQKLYDAIRTPLANELETL